MVKLCKIMCKHLLEKVGNFHLSSLDSYLHFFFLLRIRPSLFSLWLAKQLDSYLHNFKQVAAITLINCRLPGILSRAHPAGVPLPVSHPSLLCFCMSLSFQPFFGGRSKKVFKSYNCWSKSNPKFIWWAPVALLNIPSALVFKRPLAACQELCRKACSESEGVHPPDGLYKNAETWDGPSITTDSITLVTWEAQLHSKPGVLAECSSHRMLPALLFPATDGQIPHTDPMWHNYTYIYNMYLSCTHQRYH